MENKINKYPRKPGIYKITCDINGKIYIGKSVNLHERINTHRRCENKSKGDFHFENAIVKYGWDSFSVEILDVLENFDKKIDNEKLLLIESDYIKKFNTTDREIGYNVCKYSSDSTGIPKKPFTDEHKRNISIGRSGIPHKGHSPEALQKMRQSKIGKKRPPFSEEWKQNIGRGHVGMKMSEDAKRKIGEALKGKPKSAEHIEKMRQNSSGRKASEETKRKMSESQKGKKISEEQKDRLRSYNKNRVFTSETKEKMRQSRLAFLQKQKELIKEQ